MANTYKDNPSRGLSKLQKAILVWLYGETDWERWKDLPDELYDEQLPECVYLRHRPTFYGKPLNVFGGKSNYWYGETPAVTRSLNRLVERGLVVRVYAFWYYGGERARKVCLTRKGIEVSKRLVADGVTAKYKDKRPAALETLYSLGRKPCPVCGGRVGAGGHCDTEGCANNPT